MLCFSRAASARRRWRTKRVWQPRAVAITPVNHRGRLRATVTAHVPRDKTILLMTCVLVLAVLIALAAVLGPWWPDGLATLPPAKARLIRLARQDTGPGPTQRTLEPDGPQMLLAPNVRSLGTIAGPLTISTTGSEDRLTVNGKRLALPGPRFTLLAIMRRAGQDVVLLGVRCGGAACTYDELTFLRLYADRPPLVETRPELRVPVAAFAELGQHIQFAGDTMKVQLAVERSTQLIATIGPQQPLALAHVPLRTVALSRGQCGAVQRLIVECAAFRRPCSEDEYGSFPQNCPSAPARFARDVNQLAAATSGFDQAAFARMCSHASRISVVPSDEFVRRELCSGKRR
jgi:hypothetical protein